MLKSKYKDFCKHNSSEKEIVMKRLFAFILLVIMCLGVVSCTNEAVEKKYSGNSIIVKNGRLRRLPLYYEDDNPFENPWAVAPSDMEAEEDAPCEFEGVSYLGKYTESNFPIGSQETLHKFVRENEMEYTLTDSGKLKNIKFYFTKEIAFLQYVQNPAQHAVPVAREVASKYIDLAEYEEIAGEKTSLVKIFDGLGCGVDYYTTIFVKKIQGIYTSDYIAVKVDSKGTVAEVDFGTFGAFDDITAKIDMDKVNADIEDRIDTAFKTEVTTQNFKTLHMRTATEIEQQILTITPENELVIVSRVHIESYNATLRGYKYEESDTITVVTKLNADNFIETQDLTLS